MKKSSIIKVFLFVPVLALYYRYFLIPNYPFPSPPPDALRSSEPGDNETPYRRAYFTDYTREQVIAHYKAQVSYLPILELNYPPEEAQTIIRDQTRSWYLEELVQPLRSSLYINGFISQKAQDDIVINGKKYVEKITIKYVPSSLIVRLLIATGILISGYVLLYEWRKTILSLLS